MKFASLSLSLGKGDSAGQGSDSQSSEVTPFPQESPSLSS